MAGCEREGGRVCVRVCACVRVSSVCMRVRVRKRVYERIC